MKNCKPLSKREYRKSLEKKKRSELIDILTEKSCFVSLNASKTELIERIINLPDNPKKYLQKSKKNKLKINEDELRNTIKRLFNAVIIIIILQTIFLFVQFLYTMLFQNFCDPNSKNFFRCIRCPQNAICHKKKIICVENFTYFNGFCLPNSSDYEQLPPLIVIAKDKLKKRAGLYKCKEYPIDWLSQEDIENAIFKYHGSNKNLSRLLNLTIEYLLHETDINTIEVGNSTVFVSTEFTKSIKCSVKSMIFTSIIFFIIALIINIIYYYSRRNYIYEIQADQCLPSIVSYIKSSFSNQVSQTVLKKYTEPMVKNNDIVWKFIETKLKKSPTIGWKKDQGEIYYFIDGN